MASPPPPENPPSSPFPDDDLAASALHSEPDSEVGYLGSSFDLQTTTLIASRPPTPNRHLCKEKAAHTPNGRVWAHRIEDLVEDYTGHFWSPSMVQIADETHVYDPPFRERLYGKNWEMPDEPRPRKLRIWPLLTVSDRIECPEDLLDLKDETVADGGVPTEDVVDEESNRNEKQEVPKLEQRIPQHLLPEILIVKDDRNRTDSRKDGESDFEIKYRRLYPKPTTNAEFDVPRTTAHLDLTADLPRIGDGSHAAVYHAYLSLGEPFELVQHQLALKSVSSGSSPAKVRVAAKIAFGGATDRRMLENEGQIYDALPTHFSEDWSGFNAIGESRTNYTDERVPATAVVPKFYGYFVPLEESGRGKPILLLEECGRPIDPSSLTLAERAICFAFLYRLASENFMQNSFYARNILIQPGPLTLPPHQRSLENASFRLIDFGRGKRLRPSLGEYEAALTPASRRREIEEERRALYRREKAVAMDAIFGKLVTIRVGFDRYYEGQLEPANRIRVREFLANSAAGCHSWDIVH